MTKLSVNVNKLATLRNSRGKNNPDVVAWAKKIESHGAHGITVHPRPDGRHIRFSDVRALKPVVKGEFNIEGYPDTAWIDLVREVRPDQATLVPDPPEALTSNAGFKVQTAAKLLESAVKALSGVRISVFIDPREFSKADAESLKKIGVDRIELYTERFAEAWDQGKTDRDAILAEYKTAAEWARSAGLGVNAGHDLSLLNLSAFVRAIPEVAEVSIGHALIADALELGMEETIRRYLNSLSLA